jgi:hypothetical protein
MRGSSSTMRIERPAELVSSMPVPAARLGANARGSDTYLMVMTFVPSRRPILTTRNKRDGRLGKARRA